MLSLIRKPRKAVVAMLLISALWMAEGVRCGDKYYSVEHSAGVRP